MFFSKNFIFKQHKYLHFLNFSTRAFNYYKLKCGECLCIAHELRVKIVNFDINYLCIGMVEKFLIDLLYKLLFCLNISSFLKKFYQGSISLHTTLIPHHLGIQISQKFMR